MKIEHIAMYVTDLEEAKDFLYAILAENQIVNIIIRRQISGPILSVSTMAPGWN